FHCEQRVSWATAKPVVSSALDMVNDCRVWWHVPLGSYAYDRFANASGGRRAADRSHHAADPEQCARHFLRAARRVLPIDGDGLRPAEAVVPFQLTAWRAEAPGRLFHQRFSSSMAWP